MEHCARKGAPIRSLTGIGAGLGEHLAPMERPDKIPIGDRGGFGEWFANRVWRWRVATPPQTNPIAILNVSSTTQLTIYTDADWAGCPVTRRSTSGYWVFLGDNLLSWSAKRQVTLSRSSAEAEYRGVANVVAETAWIRNLLRELHTPLFTATLVYCDNVSVVYMSANPVQHHRTKHIEIGIHFVRDFVASGQVRVLHVPSRFQYADIFTKGLPTALFLEFRTRTSRVRRCRRSLLVEFLVRYFIASRLPTIQRSQQVISIMGQIQEKYFDDTFEYRHVVLPPKVNTHGEEEDGESRALDDALLLVKRRKVCVQLKLKFMRKERKYPSLKLNIVSESGSLYLFDVEQNGMSMYGLSNSAFVCHVSKQLWHNRLGHPFDQVLFILSKSIGLRYDKHTYPCDIRHKARQTMDRFPLSDHKSVFVGDLAYLIKTKDEVAFYIESFVELIHAQFNKKIKVFRSDNGAEFVNNKLGMFFNEKSESLEKLNVSQSKSQLNLLNFFDNTNGNTLEKPNDDKRDPSNGDGNEMASNIHKSPHPVNEEATFATQIDENNIISKGSQFDSNGSRSGVESESYTNIGDEPQTVRKSNKVEAMNNEMEALFRNNTWILTDLPVNINTVRCKWLFKIKYKSSGEIGRYKARLVAKGYSQRKGNDYEETFSDVVKMVTVRCLISLFVHNNWPLFQLDVNNAFLYGDLLIDLPHGYYD
ncbi:ribonuclease H-like domain-containing protein [Tanacetum coccineum]